MIPIPMVWRIDVEPDDFQPGEGRPPWNGLVAMSALVDRVRRQLEDCSGSRVNPTWLLRMDPDVSRCYGTPDYAVRAYPAIFDSLRGHGDAFGLHVHFYQWDEERQESYSEHADASWLRTCLDTAVETFTLTFGTRPRRHRAISPRAPPFRRPRSQNRNTAPRDLTPGSRTCPTRDRKSTRLNSSHRT